MTLTTGVRYDRYELHDTHHNKNSGSRISPSIGAIRDVNDDLALQPFKSGIFRLAQECPSVPLVPIWIKNARNVLPKGFMIPIPLLCELIVGEEIFYSGEGKGEFLQKAQDALLAMSETQNDKTKA